MFFKIVGIIFGVIYVTLNIFVITTMTAKEMKRDFIEEQCIFGAIFACIFYAPAWACKGIKFLFGKK